MKRTKIGPGSVPGGSAIEQALPAHINAFCEDFTQFIFIIIDYIRKNPRKY